MGRVVFLNGDFIPEGEAKLSIFDRGLLFADAVYEGFGILDGQITDFAYHMDRLDSSLAKLSMPSPMERDAMLAALMRLIGENQQNEGFLYLHITRGEGDRNYLYDDSYTRQIFLPSPRLRNSPPMLRQNLSHWPACRTFAGPAATSRRPICWDR